MIFQKIIIKILFIVALCLFVTTSAVALHTFPDTTYVNKNKDFNINIALDTGLIIGQLDEFVFDNGAKVSELNWELIPIYYLGGNIKANYKRIFLSFGYWLGLNKNAGYIEDSDWNEITGEHIAYSRHTCIIDTAHFIDLNLYYLILQNKCFDLSLSIGFNYKKIRLKAVDGYYQYPPGSPRVNLYGTGISYEQEYMIPYFGMSISFHFLKNLDTGLYLYYSPFTMCNAHDRHFSRVPQIDFYDSMEFGHYFSTGLKGGYSLSENFTIYLYFQYIKLLKTKGDSYYIETGLKSDTFENGAGFGLVMFNISVGIQYNVFMM